MTQPNACGYLFPSADQEPQDYDDMCAVFMLKNNQRVVDQLHELEGYFVDEGGWCLRPEGMIDRLEVRLRSDDYYHDHMTADQLAEWFGFEPEDVVESYIDVV